jgi:hypothetical protein
MLGLALPAQVRCFPFHVDGTATLHQHGTRIKDESPRDRNSVLGGEMRERAADSGIAVVGRTGPESRNRDEKPVAWNGTSIRKRTSVDGVLLAGETSRFRERWEPEEPSRAKP